MDGAGFRRPVYVQVRHVELVRMDALSSVTLSPELIIGSPRAASHGPCLDRWQFAHAVRTAGAAVVAFGLLSAAAISQPLNSTRGVRK